MTTTTTHDQTTQPEQRWTLTDEQRDSILSSTRPYGDAHTDEELQALAKEYAALLSDPITDTHTLSARDLWTRLANQRELNLVVQRIPLTALQPDYYEDSQAALKLTGERKAKELLYQLGDKLDGVFESHVQAHGELCPVMLLELLVLVQATYQAVLDTVLASDAPEHVLDDALSSLDELKRGLIHVHVALAGEQDAALRTRLVDLIVAVAQPARMIDRLESIIRSLPSYH